MDWTSVVEWNAKRLQRILAMLVAMAGLTSSQSHPAACAISQSPPLRGRCPAGQREVGSEDTTLNHPPLSASPTSPPQGGRLELPRRLHRAILRQLRPLESATRRLIIVAARDLPVPALPPLRRRKPEPDLKAAPAPLRSLGLAVIVSPADIARAAAEKRAAEKRPAARANRAARPLALPLVDPRKRFGPRRKYVPAHAAPRIIFFDGSIPHKLPPPPGPHDQIDATRLALRLAGISRALADLPAQAQRYVRWKARRNRDAANAQTRASRVRAIYRISPLRPGRAPGWRKRSKDEINEILADMQYFAREVLRAPDTS